MKKEFNKILFRWHKTHYRDMPWRRTHDPYRILVSEIMLQQTQVTRVRMKYVKFLKKFPSVMALAKAPLGDVLRLWSGLGYNRRARYLHECAKRVIGDHGGRFPADLEELRTLPGIGLSTAGALLAFAFAKDEPMIDTNIRRILTRVFFGAGSKKVQGEDGQLLQGFTFQGTTKSTSIFLRGVPLRKIGRQGETLDRLHLVPFHRVPSDKELYVFAKSLIPKGKGRAWNYAMLDLGATLCTARNHSDSCPFVKLHGKVGDFRYKKPQKKFAGSDRFYRGQIVRSLTERGALTPVELSKRLELALPKVRELLKSLCREELVVFSGKKAALPN